MACYLKPSIDRMKEKLRAIRTESCTALTTFNYLSKDGNKYMTLSTAIGKIAVLVRDTLTVREYWYAKFVEEGVLVPAKEVR